MTSKTENKILDKLLKLRGVSEGWQTLLCIIICGDMQDYTMKDKLKTIHEVRTKHYELTPILSDEQLKTWNNKALKLIPKENVSRKPLTTDEVKAYGLYLFKNEVIKTL